jgi:hypothetical protein
VAAPAHGLDTAAELTMHCFDTRSKGDLRPGREIQDLRLARQRHLDPKGGPRSPTGPTKTHTNTVPRMINRPAERSCKGRTCYP